MTAADDGCCLREPDHEGPCEWECSDCHGTGLCVECMGGCYCDDVVACELCDGSEACPNCDNGRITGD